jgi:4-hydroxy-tetrahydrodipicolinate reductase
MKITISGYGKMGKEVEKIARNRNHDIVAIIDSPNDWVKHNKVLQNTDVIIDFSQADVILENIDRSFMLKLPFVTGTTGWDIEMDAVKQKCIERKNSLFVASNFSIGMNLFFEINQKLAALMKGQFEYEISMEEIHHIHKKDAPSGTAISLANQIIKMNPYKKEWTNGSEPQSDQIEILSRREGEVPGTHIISYKSEIDEIEIKHVAKNRKGFALGAVMAAEWIKGKTGFFGMKDMLSL